MKRLTCHGWGSSKIDLSGSGILKIFIEEELNFIGSSLFNYQGDPAQVVIYYRGEEDITFSGDAKVYGCLFSFSDKADFYLKGSGGVNGVVFLRGGKVGITGGTEAVVSVLYAPNAQVSLTGGGKLSGAIVCDSFSADGGTKVVYDSRIEDVWERVPELGFDFGDAPGTGSDNGDDPGDPGGPGYGSAYTRVWSN